MLRRLEPARAPAGPTHATAGAIEAFEELERLGPAAAGAVETLLEFWQNPASISPPNPPDPMGGYSDLAEPDVVYRVSDLAENALVAIGDAALASLEPRLQERAGWLLLHADIWLCSGRSPRDADLVARLSAALVSPGFSPHQRRQVADRLTACAERGAELSAPTLEALVLSLADPACHWAAWLLLRYALPPGKGSVQRESSMDGHVVAYHLSVMTFRPAEPRDPVRDGQVRAAVRAAIQASPGLPARIAELVRGRTSAGWDVWAVFHEIPGVIDAVREAVSAARPHEIGAAAQSLRGVWPEALASLPEETRQALSKARR